MRAAEAGLSSTGFGAALLQTTLALVIVCVLAAVLLRLLRGRLSPGAGPLRVVARLSLEPRRTLYVVEAAGKFLLVGAGEGPLSLLCELDGAGVVQWAEQAPAAASDTRGPLAAELRRAIFGRP